MAAYAHSRAGSRNSLAHGDQELPSGSCNYRDLSIGSRAPVCGCTKFWLNYSLYNGQDGGSWCFCGHHACFHSASSQLPRPQEPAPGASRVMTVEEHVVTEQAAPPNLPATSKPLAGLGIRPESRSQSQSINTRVWQALNDFARNQEEGEVSETSRLPSTAAPSLIEEQISNRLVQENLHQTRPMAPPVTIPPGIAPRTAEEYSATEVATPSVAGTPDFRALASSSTGQRPSPGHIPPGRIESQPNRAETAPHVAKNQKGPPAVRPQAGPAAATTLTLSAQDFQTMIRAHGQRLEVLESLSFSHVHAEEVQERLELLDGRLLDLEQWRTDHEQAHDSPEPRQGSSNKRRRLLPTETGSFGSDASFDSSAAAHTEAAVLATLAANAETHPRIDALESRVADLENVAMPSYARPWTVQVVLLPFGPRLRGVWFSLAEATQHSMKSTTQISEREWTGAQSGPKLSFKSATTGAWTTESIEAWANDTQDWLSPKACGPSGTVFQRLQSRGLVREITFTGSDPRHMLDAIHGVYGDLIRTENEPDLDAEEMNKYRGLGEHFIPLRKVRKSSRLRFLSSAEMVTPATWTASFLDTSVFMKVNDGQRRLYLTTPDAYLQPTRQELWTWDKIRDLPLFQPSGGEQAVQADNVAIEACWSFNEQLDRVASIHSSFASHQSQWSTRSQVATTEDAERQPMSPSDANPPRQRTVSLPSSNGAAERAKESLPKRRVASFEPSATVPIHADEAGVENVAKRRRISMSPEAERRGVNFTPRWSREPPSPFASEAAAEARSQGAGSRKRGATPFAYATPHSNNNFAARMDLMVDDGDTEVNTDIAGDQSQRGEEEWEGVEDGNTNRSDDESIEHEQDMDEDDLEEGLTIYER